MPPKPDRAHLADALTHGFDAGVIRGMGGTAEQRRQITGQSVGATLEEMARDAGLHDSAPGDLGAVVRISGRAYR